MPGQPAERFRCVRTRNRVRIFVEMIIGIEEIARLAGVSVGTVDRALHGRKGISEETRRRVLETANRFGYETNWAARALARGRPNIRIGVCIPSEFESFYGRIRDGILDEAKRHKHLGLDLLFARIGRPGHGEVEVLRAMRSTGVNAVIMTPGDPCKVGVEIDSAEREGVRVVCVASDAAGTARSTVVCVEPELSGRLAAELMGMLVPAAARVAVVAGILSTDDQRLKASAFREAFPDYCPRGSVVDVIEGKDDELETAVNCARLLERDGAVDGLYVANAMCLPVCAVICAKGLSGAVKLVTTDLFEAMAPYFEQGTISVSIHQKPFRQGQAAVRLIVDHFITRAAIPKSWYLAPGVVLRSNLHVYRETRGAGPRDREAHPHGERSSPSLAGM